MKRGVIAVLFLFALIACSSRGSMKYDPGPHGVGSTAIKAKVVARVSSLRRADGTTYEEFLKKRIERLCGAPSAAIHYLAYVHGHYAGRTFLWVVTFFFEKEVSCSTPNAESPIAGVWADTGEVVSVDLTADERTDSEGDRVYVPPSKPTWLDDFRRGAAS